VVGDSNTTVEEVLYMTIHASKLTLVHRRDKWLSHSKITVILDYVVDDIIDTEKPKSVTGSTTQCKNMVFLLLWHSPQMEVFKD